MPVDQDGHEELPDDDLPESPEELLSRRIDFVVCIERATDLPSNFCRDVFVEYQIYLEDKKYQTKIAEGKNRNPVFEYQQHHTQQVVTENFLQYIKEQVLVMKVYGFPDVKKQENTTAGASAKRKDQIK